MIIKRKVLKSIYGEDAFPVELKPLPKARSMPSTNGNGNGHHNGHSNSHENNLQDQDIEAQAESRIQARVDELYARKEAEVAAIEKQAQIDIQKALDESKTLAQQILNDAQSQADTLKQEALAEINKQKQELDLLTQSETVRGFDEGMSKAETYVSELMTILSNFNQAKQEIVLEVKDQIASLAIHVARQILDREVQVNPELLEEQILKAVNLVSSNNGMVQVYLNPIDQAKAVYLEQNLSKLLDESIKLIFLKDENVDEGSCIVNTKGGSLNVSFSSQIELIKVAFEMYLGHKIEEIPGDSGLDQTEAELMRVDPSKIISTKLAQSSEPSDEDLELIESELEEFDEFAELTIDDDLDSLLKEVLMEDGADIKDDASVKIDDDIVLSEIEDENYNKEEEITLSYDNDDDLDLAKDPEDLAEDDDISLDMEEFDELADDPEAGSDDGYDSGMDDRFPEY